MQSVIVSWFILYLCMQDLNAQLDKAEVDVSDSQSKMRETEVVLIKTKEELSQVHTYIRTCSWL